MMSDMTPQNRSSLRLLLQGPVITMIAIGVLHMTYGTPVAGLTPFPVAILCIAVLYSVFVSGVLSGLISTLMTCAYVFYYIAYSVNIVKFPTVHEEAIMRTMSWSFSLTVMVLIVGILKRRSNELAALKSSGHERDELYAAIPYLLVSCGADGALTSVNERWREYTGLSMSDSFGSKWMHRIHPEETDAVAGRWKAGIAGLKRFEVEFRLRDKEGSFRWFWLTAEPIVSVQGAIEKWIATMTDIDSRKRAEAELSTQKKRSDLLLSPTYRRLFWSTDRNGIINFCDGSGLRQLGLAPNDRVGKNIFEESSVSPAFCDGVRQALKGSEWSAVNFRREKWLEDYIAPMHDERGEIIGVSGLSVDVSERVENEKARAELQARDKASELIRVSEAKFKGAFENSPIGIGLALPDGSWFDINPSFCKMLGYSRSEFLRMSMDDMIFEDDLVLARAHRKQLLAGESESISLEIRFRHRGGWIVYALNYGSVIRHGDGSPQYILQQTTDMTEKIRAQQLVDAANAKLQTLVKSSPAAILVLDSKRQLTVWNPACERMFGWSSSEVLGGPLPFVPPSEMVSSTEIIGRIHDGKSALFFEADRCRRDGTEMRLSVAAMPLFKEDGVPDGLMAVLTDITDRARFERNILETNRALEQATRTKSEFLANMSHEIRTPLNGVIGMAGLILDTPLSDEQRDFAETIRTSADTLLTLVNDILDFSKIEAGKIDIENVEFDLVHLINNIERTLTLPAERKGIVLKKNIHPSLKGTRWKGDPTRIGQVLLNLANNAVKFTDKGSVSIELLQLGLENQTATLQFEIKDTGIGIPEETIQRLFRAFSQADASTTRRFGGTGLGLSICKSLVTLMNGEIGVQSKPGEGSTFWFKLHLEAGSAVVEKPVAVTPVRKTVTITGRVPRILLAEDNVVNQKIAIKMIEKFGFRVDAVANGAEALDALKSVPYDLVLMDCQMPEVDGFEATRRLRAGEVPGYQDIPIIAMTANAMEGDREECLNAGMDDYVSKPVTTEDLYQVIARQIGARLAASG